MTAPYRILITGSRTWTDRTAVWQAIATAALTNAPQNAEIIVVHGACKEGADAHAAAWINAARAANRRPVDGDPHPANWRPNGVRDNGAGYRRNAEMVDAGADICLAFVDPCAKPNCPKPKPHGSHGTSHCADLAEAAGIPTKRITA
ncbi:SLOG family protein [Streptomyces sp. NPDC001288]